MGMEEAFRNAARNEPGSEIAGQIRKTDQQIRQDKVVEREKQKFEELKKQFISLGRGWYDIRFYGDDRTLMHSRQRLDDLRQELIDRGEREAATLLIHLAQGAGLSENRPDPNFRGIIARWVFDNPLKDISYSFAKTRFSHISRIFLVVLMKDLLGHSNKQQERFDDFMHHGSGLVGDIRLPQTVHGVIRWFKSEQPTK